MLAALRINSRLHCADNDPENVDVFAATTLSSRNGNVKGFDEMIGDVIGLRRSGTRCRQHCSAEKN